MSVLRRARHQGAATQLPRRVRDQTLQGPLAPGPDGSTSPAPSCAPHGQHQDAVPERLPELTNWTELAWDRGSEPCVRATAALSPNQRLLLGTVLFGAVSYRQAADYTGVTPAEVSRHCTSALRRLSSAGAWTAAPAATDPPAAKVTPSRLTSQEP